MQEDNIRRSKSGNWPAKTSTAVRSGIQRSVRRKLAKPAIPPALPQSRPRGPWQFGKSDFLRFQIRAVPAVAFLCLQLAQNGHGVMSDLSPQCGSKADVHPTLTVDQIPLETPQSSAEQQRVYKAPEVLKWTKGNLGNFTLRKGTRSWQTAGAERTLRHVGKVAN